jgi:hypothetical protein
MKNTLPLLVTGMLLAFSATSQSNDYSQWLKTITVDGKNITILRVPATKFDPKIQSYIKDVEFLLNLLPSYYKTTNFSLGNGTRNSIETDCKNIEKEDSTYPTHYYKEELSAFMELQIEAIQHEKDAEINAEKIRIAKQKENEERQLFDKLKDGYAWINRDSTNVRSKPDLKAPVIGQIYRLSYVKAYEVDDNHVWTEIEFGEHTGYVLTKYLALEMEELKPTHDDSAYLRTGQNHFFWPTEAYTAQLKRAAAAEQARTERAANSTPHRKYITGERGGCYFINSHGNKEYVDRRFCQ